MAQRRGGTHLGALCCALLLVGGCASRGPNRVVKDRYDYGAAIGDSWKVQNLLNIVRLRYLDWPTFLKVDQVAAAYTWSVNGGLVGQIRSPFGADADSITGTVGGSYQERPTILYKPLGGTEFVSGMLTPIHPAVVLALVQSGWSADRLLETTFHSVNGFTNVNAAADATYRAAPEFLRFVRVVFGLQRENAIAFRGRAPAGGQSPAASETSASEGAFLKFYVEKMSPETRQEFELMRQDLGLSTETDTYRVVWGLQAPNDRTMAVQSRSVLGFMAALTLYVEVPPWDLEDQSAPDPVPVPESPNGGEPMMRIRSGAEAPANPYVAVRYDGDWFWIDKSDNNSKRTFAYLSLLLTVTEGGESSGSPLVLTVN